MPTIYSMGSPSTSCTYGNVTKALEMEILRYFPENYFKYIHISSQLIFREATKFRELTDAELGKRERPFLVIRPDFEPNQDVPFSNTLLTSNIYSNPNTVSRKSIFPVVKDYRNKLVLGMRMNRDQLQYEITIRVNTMVDQLDLVKMMQNMMPFNGPYQTTFTLESQIPFDLINYIALLNNMDLKKIGQIPTMMRYLRSHTSYPITYKIRNSTGLPEFFLYYPIQTTITFEDLSFDQGSKKGMVDDYFEITFRAKTEFNLPGAYLLYGDDIVPRTFDFRIRSEIGPGSEVYFPLYTMERLFEDDNMVVAGYKFYTTAIIETDEDKEGKDDEIDLTGLIDPIHIPVIQRYVSGFMQADILFKFQIYANRDLLVEKKDFDVKWHHMKIVVHNTDPSITYRVLVYANTEKLNSELVSDITDKAVDKPGMRVRVNSK